jgi:hypothetical protein
MIEQALDLLSRDDLPTWEQDCATRRELERLKEDVSRYQVAASYDQQKAARVADQVRERADRINSFLSGKRFGGREANGWGMVIGGYRYEI